MISPWFYSEDLGSVKKGFTECFERKVREIIDVLKIKTAG